MTARRLPLALLPLAAAALVAGCAALNTVTSDVTSYGTWPQGRAPGTYCYERLPSQQARADRQAELELAARGALEKAGFKPAAAGGACDVTVQLGARITRYEVSPWHDPFWHPWAYGRGYWRSPWGGPWGSPYWNTSPQYDREVALLIRDRASGQPLYETRATNDGGYTAGGTALLAAMYEAALTDFPTPAVNPRRVSVELSKAS